MKIVARQLQVPSAYMPAMPAIPALSQRVPSLSPRSSYHDLPTLHLSGDRAMDREARVMRCAARHCLLACCAGNCTGLPGFLSVRMTLMTEIVLCKARSSRQNLCCAQCGRAPAHHVAYSVRDERFLLRTLY